MNGTQREAVICVYVDYVVSFLHRKVWNKSKKWYDVCKQWNRWNEICVQVTARSQADSASCGIVFVKTPEMLLMLFGSSWMRRWDKRLPMSMLEYGCWPTHILQTILAFVSCHFYTFACPSYLWPLVRFTQCHACMSLALQVQFSCYLFFYITVKWSVALFTVVQISGCRFFPRLHRCCRFPFHTFFRWPFFLLPSFPLPFFSCLFSVAVFLWII